ncbi:hypothetical protein EFU29_13875 [Vibrio cholerae]|nr:hypothetical protein [Vibrio cholerae]
MGGKVFSQNCLIKASEYINRIYVGVKVKLLYKLLSLVEYVYCFDINNYLVELDSIIKIGDSFIRERGEDA